MLRTSLLSAVAALGLAGPSAALTYNLEADFLNPAGPTNPWSIGGYGVAGDASTFAAFTPIPGTPTLDGYTGPTAYYGAIQNTSGALIEAGTGNYLPGAVVFHPNEAGREAVARWTAAVDGFISGTGLVQVADDFPLASRLTIYINGIVFGAYDIGSSVFEQAFSGSGFVSAGTTIDFAVGVGSNGTYFYDSTRVAVMLDFTPSVQPPAPVPVPASGALLAGALALAGTVGRRSRRRA